jgi:hypothetical protein
MRMTPEYRSPVFQPPVAGIAVTVIPMKVAILDDYQNVALTTADWSLVRDRAEITVFTDHLSDPDDMVARLRPFQAICVMHERTPLPRTSSCDSPT